MTKMQRYGVAYLVGALLTRDLLSMDLGMFVVCALMYLVGTLCFTRGED